MIHLIKEDGYVVGWEVRPTNPKEEQIAAAMRDLTFFGVNEYAIKYDGMKTTEEGTVKSLRWIQKKYSKSWKR